MKDDYNLDHIVCPCDEDVALCGTDTSEIPWAAGELDPGETCVVCLALADSACPQCGALLT